MRHEELQDPMLFNIFNSLQNDTTDYNEIEEKLTALIIDLVSTAFCMDSISFDAELDSGCTVRFFNEDEQCILVVEVVE